MFVSHGWTDKWVAEQISHRLKHDCAVESFLDVFDIEKGDDFERRIFSEMPKCDELIALLTPWSADRNWVWIEIGAARALDIGILAVIPDRARYANSSFLKSLTDGPVIDATDRSPAELANTIVSSASAH